VFHQRFSFLDSTRSFTSLVLAPARVLVLRRSVLIFVVRARSDPMHTPDLGFQSRCTPPMVLLAQTSFLPTIFVSAPVKDPSFTSVSLLLLEGLGFPSVCSTRAPGPGLSVVFCLHSMTVIQFHFYSIFFIKSRSQLCVDCLRVEAGHVLEPPDQRFEVSSFSSCFTRGFFVTHIKCSMKCVCDSSSDFDHQILLMTFRAVIPRF
jgi:hypothetical protein